MLIQLTLYSNGGVGPYTKHIVADPTILDLSDIELNALLDQYIDEHEKKGHKSVMAYALDEHGAYGTIPVMQRELDPDLIAPKAAEKLIRGDTQPEFVPKTIEEAVNHIVDNLKEKDRQYILTQPPESVHFGTGMGLRNGWKIWYPDTPLKRDAAQTYGIAHADDISSLILDWAWAKTRGEAFDPKAACERFHKHWPQYGQTSLSAGGWKEDASGPTEESLRHWERNYGKD